MLIPRRSIAEPAMAKPKSTAPEPVSQTDARLDEALDETFPASDPIAVHPPTPAPVASPVRHAPRKPARAAPGRRTAR
jgi:hypothetical protein